MSHSLPQPVPAAHPVGGSVQRSRNISPNARLTFPRVLASEWGKFWSLRSSYWVCAITLLIGIGFGLIMMFALQAAADEGRPQAVAAGEGAMPLLLTMPLIFGSMVVGTLGALTVSNEYSSGQIRSSLTTVPSRTPFFFAKVLTILVVSVFLSVIIYSAINLLAHLVLSDSHILSPTHADNLRTLLTTIGALTAIALMGAGFGFTFRNTAMAITSVFVALFVAWVVLQLAGGFLSQLWEPLGKLIDYLPTSAAVALLNPEAASDASVLRNVLTLAAWSLLPLGVGLATLKSKDA
ncbi:ABC transporter permease subunit [Buchananella hordeovulneris]|uniref:ABC transporter permease subunit n=1 Tax=Buchananella hordeovulneris TaxID=52770 RepID=UPI000F5D5F77|nr:ABC transporter permease subunit [Buchananella hordeovulneris]RRD43815.1 hypothetical protein EII13_05955 [Buchananella hordeovulneris]